MSHDIVYALKTCLMAASVATVSLPSTVYAHRVYFSSLSARWRQIRAKRAVEWATRDTEERRKHGKHDRKQNKRRRSGNMPHGQYNAAGSSATAEDILALEWLPRSMDDLPSDYMRRRFDPSNKGEEVRGQGGNSKRLDPLTLHTYIKLRQESQVEKGNASTDQRRAEELRKTALFGPVLNDGRRYN